MWDIQTQATNRGRHSATEGSVGVVLALGLAVAWARQRPSSLKKETAEANMVTSMSTCTMSVEATNHVEFPVTLVLGINNGL